MFAGAYTLDMYCDNGEWGFPDHPFQYLPKQYVGETFQECKREAIKAGWTFKKDKHICPLCNKKGKQHG